jgi:hypothetical protein
MAEMPSRIAAAYRFGRQRHRPGAAGLNRCRRAVGKSMTSEAIVDAAQALPVLLSGADLKFSLRARKKSG